jgi:membrane-associated protein
VIAFSLVEKIVEWVEPAFLVAGYAIIAGAVLMERSIFIGLIVPGDLILALGGVYSAQGKLNLVAVIAIGTVSAIAGESTGYWIGRRFGLRILRHIPLLNRLEGRIRESRDYFRKHGGKTVAIGRYATAAGAFIPFTAGAARMDYPRFLMFDIPAIIVWATGISVFGFVFGDHLEFVDTVLSRFGYIVLGLLVVFFLGRWLWRRNQERRHLGQKPNSPGSAQ